MLKIKIETNNQAFVDDFENEIQYCLDEVVYNVCEGEKEYPIHDSNGNNVGNFKLTNR